MREYDNTYLNSTEHIEECQRWERFWDSSKGRLERIKAEMKENADAGNKSNQA